MHRIVSGWGFVCLVAIACSADDMPIPDAGKPANEEALVKRVVAEYFIARDKQWLQTEQPAFTTGRLPSGQDTFEIE
jgi:hypothetical protein